ncbi:hypothetical protein TCON_1516 [Astathelohania contejeani]|uniref:Uncharacterized protein n=1 Tax=Astathelohania contejeani TaxID=164912 RepID=A0ABQ7HYP7_9MICR|nr:hypothetical protein TCON_1516 [Thelohania contejeani]
MNAKIYTINVNSRDIIIIDINFYYYEPIIIIRYLLKNKIRYKAALSKIRRQCLKYKFNVGKNKIISDDKRCKYGNSITKNVILEYVIRVYQGLYIAENYSNSSLVYSVNIYKL